MSLLTEALADQRDVHPRRNADNCDLAVEGQLGPPPHCAGVLLATLVLTGGVEVDRGMRGNK